MKKRQILLLILFLTIGFAGVATTLFIAGRTKIGFNENFYDEIYFSKSIEDSIDTSEESIIDSGKKITYKTKELKSIGDKSILEYTILNNSKQYTAHGVVSLVYEESSNIKVTNTLTEFDLEAGNTLDGVLTVELVKSVEEDIEIPIDVIIDITPKEQEYTGITTTTKEAETDTPTITIDTDGGLYEGEGGKIVKTFQSGETYNLLVPTKEGYEFLGWETSIEGIIVDNTITLGKKHLTIKATWREIPKDYKVQINDKKYESISKALEAANASDTITLLKDVTEDFTNGKTVTIDLGGFTLHSEITNNGNLTLQNGIVEGNKSTTIINNGTLTLGVNDENVLLGSIAIIGTEIGIEQNGVLNFYDGYIEAKVGLNGNVQDLPENYHIFVDHNDEKDCQKVILVDVVSNAVSKTTKDGTIYYKNLQDSIRVSELDNKTIYAVRDFQAAYPLSISEDKAITFDIAGYNVELGNDVTNNGTLTLTDTAVTKGILKPSATIINNKRLNIKDITMTETTNLNMIKNNSSVHITNSALTALDGYVIYNYDGHEIVMDETSTLTANKYAIRNETSTNDITITGGTIKGIENIYRSNGTQEKSKLFLNNIKELSKGSASYAISNTSGDLTIDGINIDVKGDGIYNPGGKITLNSGNICSEGQTINSGQIIVNGGTITNNSKGSYWYEGAISGGTVTINDGEIYSSSGIVINKGSVTIHGGYIHSDNNKAIDDASVTINNGKIESLESYAIDVTGCDYPYITVNGGEILGKTGILVGSYKGGKVEIAGGEIRASDNGVEFSYSLTETIIRGGIIDGGKYGLYNVNNASYAKKVIIGQKDNEEENNKLTIKGGLYAIYNKMGVVRYEGGTLLGKTGICDGSVNEVSDNKRLISEITTIDEEEYYKAKLVPIEEFAENSTTNKKYDSLENAINEAENGQIIKIINEGYMTAPITIPNGKEVAIDLNGHTLTTTSTITNSGSLTIRDSSENESGILNHAGSMYFMKANGTSNFKLESGTISKYNCGTLAIIYGYNVEITGGTITGNSNLVYASNKLNVSNCNLESSQKAIEHSGRNDDVYVTSSAINRIDDGTTGSGLIYQNDSQTAFHIEDTLITNNTEKGINVRGYRLFIVNSELTSKSTSSLIDSSGYLTIEGSQLFSENSRAIYGSEGTIEIKSGRVESKSANAIEFYSSWNSGGTIILGNKDGEIGKEPVIIGLNYGISAGRTKKFYDGYIKGKSASVSNSNFAELEDASVLADSEEVIDGVTYKVKSLQPEENIVSVNGTEYNSFNKAIAAIENEGTIEIITSPVLKSGFTIPTGKNITIDLKGLTLSQNSTITNEGTLNFIDSVGEGKVVSSASVPLIDSKGSINFNTVHLESTNTVLNMKAGTANIVNSILNSTRSYTITGEENESVDIAIQNSSILQGKGSTYGAYNIYLRNGNLTINSGSIEQEASYIKQAIYISNGKFTFNSGNILGGVSINTTATFEMNGGEIINHSNYESTNTVSNSGTTTINKGYIEGCFYNAGTLNMYGGTIHNKNTYNKYYSLIGLVLNNSKTTNITKGTIISDNSYAISMDSTSYTPTLNIGTNDETIKNDDILIMGATYAIYHPNANINYYDGYLKGKTDRIAGTIKEIPNNSTIKYDIEEIEGETYQISSIAEFSDIIANGETTYADVQTAIDEANTGDTLKLINDISLITDISIASDKELTIDLNGKKFNQFGIGKITNDGTVTIIDSVGTGSLNKYSAYELIINNGALNINDISMKYASKGDIYAINNNGQMNLSNVELTSEANCIKNNENATLINNGGNYNSKNRNIYNLGTTTIDGGIYTANYNFYNEQKTKNQSISLSYKNATLKKLEGYYDFFIYLSAKGQTNNTVIDNCMFEGEKGYSVNTSLSYDESSIDLEIKNSSLNGKSYLSRAKVISSDNTYGNEVTISGNREFSSTNDTYAKKLSVGGSVITTLNSPEINSPLIEVTSATAKLVINNGVLTANDQTSDYILNSGNLELNETNITINAKLGASFKSFNNQNEKAILNINHSTLNVLEAEGTSRYVNNLYGVYNTKGTTIINNSDITVNSIKNAYGIYIQDGTVTMGEKNSNNNIESPLITAIGGTSGIGVKKVSGYFNMYDGKIIGSTQAKPETASDVEYLYEANNKTDAETGYEYCVLESMN